MSIGKKICAVIMIIAGIFFCVSAVRMIAHDMPEAKKIMADAIYVGSAGYDASNDGKVVVVTGEYKLKKPAYDEKLGISIDAARAVRNALYVRINNENNPTSTAETDSRYVDWKTDLGADGDFIGEASVGEYQLADDFLTAITTSKTYDAYDAEALENAGMGVIKDKKFVQEYFVQWKDEIDGIYKDGERRYYYSVPKFADGQEVTVIAKQEGNVLHNVSELTDNMLEGALSENEVIESSGKTSASTIIFSIIFSLGLLAGGVVIFRKS